MGKSQGKGDGRGAGGYGEGENKPSGVNWESGDRAAYNNGWAKRSGVDGAADAPPLPPVDAFRLPLNEAQQILNSIGQHALKAPSGTPSSAPAAPVKPW